MTDFIRKFFDIKKREFPVAVLLFAFFFLVIVVFQMLYPLKKGLFLEHYGANLELYAKLANILAAALAVTAFTFLYNKLPRQRLIYVLAAFFIASFTLLTVTLRAPGPLTIWGFYLLGDLITTLMVAGFWAYATDLSSSDQAKRLFGVIGGGGIIGGLLGISLTKVLLRQLGAQGLMLLAAACMGTIILVTFGIESLLGRTGAFRAATGTRSRARGAPAKRMKLSAAIEGAELVMRSKYLAAIVGIMAFYEMASQVMDYQFSRYVEGLSGVVATQAFVADVRFYANALSVVVQFFLVSLIMRKLGLVVALLVLPVAILGSSGAFLAVSTLAVASLLHISDNGFNYSIQQTARESLYVVTTPEEKYKARAFTNMFVQRLAKGLSIFLVMGLSALRTEISYLSLVTIAVAVVMVLCSVYAGRRFAAKSKLEEGELPAVAQAA